MTDKITKFLPRLSIEQAVILTGYSGFACCAFSHFHKDVEARLGRKVKTYELADKEMQIRIKNLYQADFMKIVPKE